TEDRALALLPSQRRSARQTNCVAQEAVAAARSAESHEGDTMSTEKLNKEQIHARVTAAYGAAARAREEGTQAAACCAREQRTASDYTAEELASVPRGAYLGEGSG